MTLRLVVLFFALLAIASVADAQCLTCVSNGISPDGTCEPSSNGRCSYTCCLSDQGTRCNTRENTYGCSGDNLYIVPTEYFATALPLQMRGSSLRLKLGSGKPVQRKRCNLSLMRQQQTS